MAKINARAKGANGERELCEWIHNKFGTEIKPKRNLEQVRNSGADIIFQPFAFEVKRVEELDILNAWHQIVRAVSNPKGEAYGLEPVLAFRKNKQKWNFVIDSKYIGVEGSYIQLTEVGFKKWVDKYLANYQRDMFLCQKEETVKIYHSL